MKAKLLMLYALMALTTSLACSREGKNDDIYCITEKGSIRASDMQRAFDFLHTKSEKTKSSNEEISFYDMGRDFVPAFILSSMLADLKYGKISDAQDTKTPVATTNSILLKTKWGQGAHYNMYLNECATGCVSTACAQIMEYCKVPPHPIFDDIQCNWKTMELVRNVDNMYDDYYPETAKRQVGHFSTNRDYDWDFSIITYSTPY